MLSSSTLVRPSNSDPELAEGPAALSKYAFESQLSRREIRPAPLTNCADAHPAGARVNFIQPFGTRVLLFGSSLIKYLGLHQGHNPFANRAKIAETY